MQWNVARFEYRFDFHREWFAARATIPQTRSRRFSPRTGCVPDRTAMRAGWTVWPQTAFDVGDCGFLASKMRDVKFGLHGRFSLIDLNLGVVAFYVKCNVAQREHAW